MRKCLLISPVLSLSGYGVHSRQILFALSQKFDLACQALRWGETQFMFDETPEKQFIIESIKKTHYWQQSKIIPHLSVQVTVPNEWKRITPNDIGITAGIEVDRVKPEWLIKCNEMNLIIVPSEFTKNGFEKTMYQTQVGSVLKLDTPIEVVPESVDTSIFNERKTEDLELKDVTTSFNFLTVGQWGIGDIDRKNITTLIKIFKETFAEHKDREKIGLILRINSVTGSLIDEDYTIKKIKSIIKDYNEFPRIYLIHGFMSELELARLYKDSRVKCFVTLTKGEGYGLPLLEAAACDLPIMATNWSGHLDFLNLGKWIKIPYELKEIEFNNDLFQQGARWAIVDKNEVKRHFLKFYENWTIPKKWAEDLGKQIRSNLNIKSVEDKYFEVLNKYNLISDEETEKNRIANSIFGNMNLQEVVK